MMSGALEAALRAFALKECELAGWEPTDALVAEREALWRDEVEAAVEGLLGALVEQLQVTASDALIQRIAEALDGHCFCGAKLSGVLSVSDREAIGRVLSALSCGGDSR
jgi:hypothetical protein